MIPTIHLTHHYVKTNQNVSDKTILCRCTKYYNTTLHTTYDFLKFHEDKTASAAGYLCTKTMISDGKTAPQLAVPASSLPRSDLIVVNQY